MKLRGTQSSSSSTSKATTSATATTGKSTTNLTSKSISGSSMKAGTSSSSRRIISPPPPLEQMVPSTSKSSSILAATSSSAYSTRRSSTASAEFSPDSPSFGRVAKSNARLLNGLLSSGKGIGGSCLDNTAVALPELKTFELAEKCPTINKLLKEANEGGAGSSSGGDDAVKVNINMDQLSIIQMELEELCAQNVDYQKTIHGEITYLTTGEYPTEDLRSRLMPSYSKLTQEQFKKLTDRAKQAESTANTSLADMGLLSSPDEDETPHILDVPQRFWTWAREYLRHVSADTVKQYQEKLLARFSEELILGKYCQEDTKFDQKQQISSPTKKLSSPTKSSTKGQQLALKRKHSIEENLTEFGDDNLELEQNALGKSGKTPTKQAKIAQQQKSTGTAVGKLATMDSAKGTTKRWAKYYPILEPARASMASTNLLLNQNGSKISATKSSSSTLSNGLNTRLSNGSSTSTATLKAKVGAKLSGMKQILPQTATRHRRSSKTPISPVSLSKAKLNPAEKSKSKGKLPASKIVETPRGKGGTFFREEAEAQSSDEEDEEEEEDWEEENEQEEEGPEEGDKVGNDEGEEMEMEQKPGTSSGGIGGVLGATPAVQDEVTAELAKKQAQLRELYARTRPNIERIYTRLLMEYAVDRAFHEMDDADNKLFEIGSKFERLYTFNREQKQETKSAVQVHQQSFAKFHPNAEIGGGSVGAVGGNKAKPMKTGK